MSLIGSYMISRLLGLPKRTAVVLACGNSICGNSAIVAVAPVIRAHASEVGAAIAFTAVLGVVMVLGLPLLQPLFALSVTQYGMLAGMTVYAVPQVMAATLPLGALANQVGTIVKLVRVLMLAPLVLVLSVISSRFSDPQAADRAPSSPVSRVMPPLHRLVPWFIVAFLMMATCRSLALVPNGWLAPMKTLTVVLTVVSMAALGLTVNVREVARAGLRVSLAVCLSLTLLVTMTLVFLLWAPARIS
jgi:uncharacterized integral membrane protein (TIGR00698 family)